MDEHDVIARLKGGDIAGLELLVRRYQAEAIHAAYLIARDRALAEDLVQAAFLRVYERIAQFDATRRPFPSMVPAYRRQRRRQGVRAA